MLPNNQTSSLINSVNAEKQSIVNKYREEIILCIGIVLFIIATVLQAKNQNMANGWQGIIAQFQVMISVFLVVYVPKKGYFLALFMNITLSVVVTLQVVVASNSLALPGIIIPISTIVIISIIELYGSRLTQKAEEFIEEKVRSNSEMLELQEVSIMAMATLAETRNHESGLHIQRTKLYVRILAEYLLHQHKYSETLNKRSIELIIASAPLHDIGKVGIPDSILLKPGKLTQDEYEMIKQHTYMGYEAITKAEKLMGKTDTFLKVAREIMLYHHERWDGLGYLAGLKGENIPLSARIMSVADMYDALTSKRVYKEVFEHKKALTIINEESGKRFDPEIVKAFVASQEAFEEIAMKYRET